MTPFDAIGLLGVVAYISAYALLQLEKVDSKNVFYLLLNAVGSIFILISLLFNFNLPSFVAQTSWLVFTAIGFFRASSTKLKAANAL